MDIINLQYDIELARANSMFEFALDNYYLECKKSEVYSDMLYMEDAKENANKGIIKKFGEFIEKIIAAIGKFFTKIKEKLFGNEKAKEAIRKIENIRNISPEQAKKRVKIMSTENIIKVYEKYIDNANKLENEIIQVTMQGKILEKYDDLQKSMDKLLNVFEVEKEKAEKKNELEMNTVEAIKKAKAIIKMNENSLNLCKERADQLIKKIQKDSRKCYTPKTYELLKALANHITQTYKNINYKIGDASNRNFKIFIAIAALCTPVAMLTSYNTKKKLDNVREQIYNIRKAKANKSNQNNSSDYEDDINTMFDQI